MKKLLLSLVLTTVVSFSTFAFNGTNPKDDANKVTYNARNQFDMNFGGAENVVWTVTADIQKATFILDDIKTTAYYNKFGEYIGYSQQLNYKSLSREAKKALLNQYASYRVTKVTKFESEDVASSALSRLAVSSFDNVAYFVTLKKDQRQLLVKITDGSTIDEVQN